MAPEPLSTVDGARHPLNPGLSLRQVSALNGFDYALVARSGAVLGSLRWPNVSQAKNARLAWHPRGSDKGDIRLSLQGDDYLLKHEYLRRGFLNDIRYTLETKAGEVLCSADVVFEARRRLPAIRVMAPVRAELLPSTSFFKRRYPVVDAAGQSLGQVYEPRLFSLRFEYGIQLSQGDARLQAFLLALALLVRR